MELMGEIAGDMVGDCMGLRGPQKRTPPWEGRRLLAVRFGKGGCGDRI